MNEIEWRMSAGDRVPNFMLADQNGIGRELYTEIAGGPIVLYFLADNTNAEHVAGLAGFAERAEAFAAFGAHVFAIAADGVAANAGTAERLGIGFPLFADADGAISARYFELAGIRAPAVFVLDPNQRVLDIVAGTAARGLAGRALEALARIPPAPEPRLYSSLAPVLVIPDVLDRDFCRRLMDLWDTGGHDLGKVDVGVGRDTAEAVVDRDYKVRSDHVIRDPAMAHALGGTIGPRLGPEIYKVHYVDDLEFERFRIACYEAKNAGFFRCHRDNSDKSVRHRRYAVTINLNTEDYEGGNLRFPEYGRDLYRPPTGGAIVFSCALLHEVLPVTRGRRLTLLSFLFTPGAGASE